MQVQVPATKVSVVKRTYESSDYRDQRFSGSAKVLEDKLKNTATLYVGNLSFYTTEEQIYELFSKCGEVKRIIMGLDRFRKTPCGFCFVEYYTRKDAEDCMKYVSQTRLDDRVIRCDWDAGFEEGRQYGRGKSGGQVRDEYRTDFDSGRGGYGKARVIMPIEEAPYGGGSQDYYPMMMAPPGGPMMVPPPPVQSKRRRDDDYEDEDSYNRRSGNKSARFDRRRGREEDDE
eukprot:comp20283_c0_seq1/m.25445 comp20283_c0_seq1/g.25445  ORF comp20283_c0_seq1/g.25445 comp20283_c0_seq1/m.25445 type:complete len:230 (-) comp20283_c0_seq1:89-778(-)